MPSPVGHSIAGICGFILARKRLCVKNEAWLLLGSVLVANLPDLDLLPGIILGDPRLFHHKGTHSLAAVAVIYFLSAILSSAWNLKKSKWVAWAVGLYAGHVLLDLMAADQVFPIGSQILWPFSEAYFISPVVAFRSVEFSDSTPSMVASLFSEHNLLTVLQELALMTPLVSSAWCFRAR